MAPKPLPISRGTARTWEIGTPQTRAVCSRTEKWPWLLLQIVSRPSSCHMAVPAWGSMYPWCTALVVVLFSTTTSARRKPSSTSPSSLSRWLATFGGQVSRSRLSGSMAACRSPWSRGASSAIASAASKTAGSGV